MVILYFHLQYFRASNTALFFTLYSDTLILHLPLQIGEFCLSFNVADHNAKTDLCYTSGLFEFY